MLHKLYVFQFTTLLKEPMHTFNVTNTALPAQYASTNSAGGAAASNPSVVRLPPSLSSTPAGRSSSTRLTKESIKPRTPAGEERFNNRHRKLMGPPRVVSRSKPKSEVIADIKKRQANQRCASGVHSTGDMTGSGDERLNVAHASRGKENWVRSGTFQGPSPMHPINLMGDALFTGQNIGEFVAQRLGISVGSVESTLLDTLTEEECTRKNMERINTALAKSINAGGSIMMAISTTDNGLYYLSAKSARRHTVMQAGGKCEEGESMADAARREFVEEFGNPSEDGILLGILNNADNLLGTAETNKIGSSARQIASRMIDDKTHASLFFMGSALYINCIPMDSHKFKQLEEEISQLNARLQKASKFYYKALAYTHPPKGSPALQDLSLDQLCKDGGPLKLIKQFKNECGDCIAPSFKKTFDLSANFGAREIISALRAIVDLSENTEIALFTESQFKAVMDLRVSNPKEFKETYFESEYDAIEQHFKLIYSND